MMILPAIDLIGGRCVRLSQGDYEQKKQYDASPLEMVEAYARHGLQRIHVVDLDGAKASHPENLDGLRQIASVPGVEIEWGGG
uniref:HisA/HisF-related TIM barrel protein n=1 Tax=Alloprevotella sp. TaxID=1872471 RepID=UPI0040280724